MTKEAIDHLRQWTASSCECGNSRFHGYVRELFEDWERLKELEPKSHEAGDRLTSEGVYE